MKSQPTVLTFFYGSYFNFDVLKEVDIVLTEWEVAYAAGFDLVIAPRANLVRSDRHIAYGILAPMSHSDLTRLYAEHAKKILGETYLPEAVLATTIDGKLRPALCYVSSDMAPNPAEQAYIKRIAKPARAFGFPQWYIDHIESFASNNLCKGSPRRG